MKKSLKAGILILIVLGVGLTLVVRQRLHAKTQVVALVRGPIHESVYGLGTVVAKNIYRLIVGVGVIVSESFVNEGALVEKGAALVRLEGGVTKAPFRGTITSLPFKEGELASPQTPVLTLTDLDSVYLEVSLEQQGALRVKKGQRAVFSFESLRNQKQTGEVKAIFPRDGQFLIHISADSFPAGILPGMTADVAIEVGSKEDALVVPLSSISGGKILVDRKGKRLRIPVTVGIVDAEKAEISSDQIQSDDQVVLKEK